MLDEELTASHKQRGHRRLCVVAKERSGAAIAKEQLIWGQIGGVGKAL